MRRVPTFAALLVLLACRSEIRPKDYGPPPGSAHQDEVRTVLDGVLHGRYRLEQASDYRFAEPVRDRVASWHWENVADGQPHAFGYRCGWRVDFWVTPHYAGYPPQPEAQRMAFFADGRLRGLFWPGNGNAPLELDRWTRDWVDFGWNPAAGAPPK